MWFTKFILSICCLGTLLNAPISFAENNSSTKIEIVVGMGIRPPFLSLSEQSGAGLDILNVMNTVQQQFLFIHKELPSKRRIQAFNEAWIDIMMWDNASSGWQECPLTASSPLVSSKDVYITFKEENRTQSFFDDLSKQRIVMVNGFHYKFADFETDIETLTNRFNLKLVRTEEAVIKMILAKRAEIGVVSETALNWFLIRYPQHYSNMFISEKYDTAYNRHFLVPENGIIEVDDINQILKLADSKGLLSPIYKKYGLTKPSFGN